MSFIGEIALCVCHLGPLPSALRASPGMTGIGLEKLKKDQNAQTTLAPPDARHVAERVRDGGTPINLQFKYQRSKPASRQIQHLENYAGPRRKIEKQSNGDFRLRSKTNDHPREIREENQRAQKTRRIAPPRFGM